MPRNCPRATAAALIVWAGSSGTDIRGDARLHNVLKIDRIRKMMPKRRTRAGGLDCAGFAWWGRCALRKGRLMDSVHRFTVMRRVQRP